LKLVYVETWKSNYQDCKVIITSNEITAVKSVLDRTIIRVPGTD